MILAAARRRPYRAVARVLNVIGIVCDALGFALSGMLAGLNGVVLAKQIGEGASNEEKAATADMMITEATSAGGHVMSLAMSYGPGFMKGFKNASKGVIVELFTGIKSELGKFARRRSVRSGTGQRTSATRWASDSPRRPAKACSRKPGMPPAAYQEGP